LKLVLVIFCILLGYKIFYKKNNNIFIVLN
jgi:hypothetical protein